LEAWLPVGRSSSGGAGSAPDTGQHHRQSVGQGPRSTADEHTNGVSIAPRSRRRRQGPDSFGPVGREPPAACETVRPPRSVRGHGDVVGVAYARDEGPSLAPPPSGGLDRDRVDGGDAAVEAQLRWQVGSAHTIGRALIKGREPSIPNRCRRREQTVGFLSGGIGSLGRTGK
jgi:hypothetical protein